MKILSITTSSNVCGVSILEDRNLILKLDLDTGKTHSENLMPMIDDIFKQTNLSLKDISLIVCDIGPGSFTGIRIGVATVKAFADSLSIPCVGVSSLESLSYNIKTDGYICSIIDRKHNNCYFALYGLKNNTYMQIIEPQATSINNVISILSNYNSPITFVGDGVDIFKNDITSSNLKYVLSELNTLNSYNIGLAGLDKYNKNSTIQEVLPLYLKESDAKKIRL